MNKTIIAIAIAMASSVCMATGYGQGSNSTSKATAASTSGATSGSTANATSNQRATSSNSLTINTPAKTVSLVKSEGALSTESRFEGRYEYQYEGHLHNTPSMAQGTPDASAPCYVGISGQFSVAGFGAGAGGSVYDQKCEEREIIRLGLSSGSQEIRNKADYVLGLQLNEVIDRYKKNQAKQNTASKPVYEQSWMNGG